MDSIDDIGLHLDDNNYIAFIFLNFSKAFDAIDHNILLSNCKLMVSEVLCCPGSKVILHAVVNSRC